jgi:hypothetical protein
MKSFESTCIEIYRFWNENRVVFNLKILFGSSLENSLFNFGENKDQFIDLGSIGKIFTRLLIIETFKDKNLSDIYVSQYLTFQNERLSKTSIFDLLGHTSGLPSSFPTSLWKTSTDDLKWENDFIVSQLEELEFNEKGSYLYSNLGYAILTLILEKENKKPYLLQLRSYLSKILGEKSEVDSTKFFDDRFNKITLVENAFIGSGGVSIQSNTLIAFLEFLINLKIGLSDLGFEEVDDKIHAISGRINGIQSVLYIRDNEFLFIESKNDFIPSSVFDAFFYNREFKAIKTSDYNHILQDSIGDYQETRRGNKISLACDVLGDFYILTHTNFKLRIIELDHNLYLISLHNCILDLEANSHFNVIQNGTVVETYLKCF